MLTHVAKCTNNFIRVPPIPPGPLEVILPVVVAKAEQSFVFTPTKFLREVPEKIKGIKPFVQNLKFEVVRGFVIFDVTVGQDVFYVWNDRVMMQSFCDVFSGAVPIPEAREGFEVRTDMTVEIFYSNSGTNIFEQVLINTRIQLVEYRNTIL